MVLAVAGLFVGKYPLSMQQLLAGDATVSYTHLGGE